MPVENKLKRSPKKWKLSGHKLNNYKIKEEEDVTVNYLLVVSCSIFFYFYEISKEKTQEIKVINNETSFLLVPYFY